ncbi:MAG: Lon protease family protein [Oligoflexales bacterium]
MKRKTTNSTTTKVRSKKSNAKKHASLGPLTEKEIYAECLPSHFKFKSTVDLTTSHDIIAQDRAIRAINIGLGIRRPGYNIYVAGIQGTGKTSVIKQFLEKWSSNTPPSNDWVYLYNFNSPDSPMATQLPRGEGRIFKKKMDHFIRTLKAEVPLAFQSEEYENTVNSYLSSNNERKSNLFLELEKLAKSMDFVIKSTRVGIETIPVIEGRQLTEKEYNKLGEDKRRDIENRRSQLEPQVLDFARKIRSIEQEAKEYLEKLREELGNQVVSSAMEGLFEDYKDEEFITDYLNQVKEDALENLLEFIEDEEKDEEGPAYAPPDRDRFNKYKVNVFVDNSNLDSAPVIIENNPTYYNLFGKIEKNVEHGMYLTDFTMIKNGAIHRANGGYLVLNALDILRTPSIWDTLKRILRNRLGFIEDMGEQYSLLPTSGLRPKPISLDLKVILIGNDEIYHILFAEDEEFHKIFKIKADFDFKMDRTPKNIESYVSFVATRSKREDLLPFEKSGVAAMVEFGSRLVEDQRLLSTQFGELKDLTIEADFIAREDGAKSVSREHVEEALNQKFYRLNLQEENILGLIRSKDILVSVDGARIGQVNALAVYDYGDYSFGKIGRITCTTSLSGSSGIINIERASHLSGKIHDKGVYILSGFLHAVLAKKRKLGISCSLCFEQSYGTIDGDSASVAELIAIVSALAEIPVKQTFGITGSVNQMGEIQSIGGVNEKIEGFLKACKMIGANKDYGVVIPFQNVPNLMLHRIVRDAVKSGYLKIYPVKHISEAFEIMTDVSLGLVDIHSKAGFPEGSALDLIEKKLEKMYQEQEKHSNVPKAPNKTQNAPKAAAKRR